jgi:EAL domain-containing protein (putative c-di-GMP-specific phosphodiesterase class I)
VSADLGSETLAALLADESSFFAAYQPVVDLASGSPVAYAASLQARRGSKVITPAELFALARTDEALARLDQLGRAVALRDATGWLGTGALHVRLLPERVAEPAAALAGLPEAAAAAGVSPRQVVVEVPLGSDRDALNHLARVMTRCRGAGCRVAIVDVREAMTVRRTVAMLAPDVVKLDRSLLAEPGAAAETVQACHEARATVVAFGVEDAAAADAARAAGADQGQGWFFGRPGPAPGTTFAP